MAQRDGYRDWDWGIRAGTVELRILRLERGSYFLGFLELQRTAERAFTAVIEEADVRRRFDALGNELVKAMGMGVALRPVCHRLTCLNIAVADAVTM